MKPRTFLLFGALLLLTTNWIACSSSSSGSSSNNADAGTTGEATGEATGGETSAWGATCAADADCVTPTDLCVLQPGAESGYCSIACPNLGADCTYADWTCNVVGGCDAPLATWCGPADEPAQTGGIVVACE